MIRRMFTDNGEMSLTYFNIFTHSSRFQQQQTQMGIVYRSNHGLACVLMMVLHF